MLSGSALKVQLEDSTGNAVENETVYISVQNINDATNYSYKCKLNDEGLGFVNIDVPAGEYEITADFLGNDNYQSSTKTAGVIILEDSQKITQSSEPLRDGIDYDSSKLTPEQYELVQNNPGGHYDLAGNYYAPGEGQ